jgi:hypothetical protein
VVEDLSRARHRLGKFLLRHGRVWRGGSIRTHAYQAWLRAQLAWIGLAYQHRPAVGLQIARRQQGLPPEGAARAWAA